MSTVAEQQIKTSSRIKKRLKAKKKYFSKGRNAAIIAGVAMALYTILVQNVSSPETASYLEQLRYVLLVGIFYALFKSYKSELPQGKIFRRGAVLGIYMSAIAAITMVLIIAATEFIFSGLHFNEFNREVDTLSEYITMDWILLFETFVFGIIGSFICLQGLKSTNKID